MEIILQKDHPELGTAGKKLTVKDGYARNYLIPYGIALQADKSALKAINEREKVERMRLTKEKRHAEKLAQQMVKVSLTAKMPTSEEDKIFGSVTTQDIVDMLAEKGIQVDRRKIHLDEPLKALGVYQVPVKLHPEVTVKVKVFVIKAD